MISYGQFTLKQLVVVGELEVPLINFMTVPPTLFSLMQKKNLHWQKHHCLFSFGLLKNPCNLIFSWIS